MGWRAMVQCPKEAMMGYFLFVTASRLMGTGGPLPRSKAAMHEAMELYLQSLICLHGVVLNQAQRQLYFSPLQLL
jgi:hypothetical protein